MSDQEKPTCRLSGQDGNVFGLIGIAARCLKKAGQNEKAKEMTQRVFKCASYEDALAIIGDYVEIE